MTIFSEIYGVYFRIAGKLLGAEKITKKLINSTIMNDGFQDSMLFLPDKLIPQKDDSDWGLFKAGDSGEYISVLKHRPKNIMTTLQKRWLAAKLDDPKMKAFLDENVISQIKNDLGDIKPLYMPENFRYTDRFSDGDNYSSVRYIRNFRSVLSAIRMGKAVKIIFFSEKNKKIYLRCFPLKIEYSAKNDKFRVHCKTVEKRRLRRNATINIGSIISVKETDDVFEKRPDMKKYYMNLRAAEPVVVRVTDERGGVERFLTEFASYEKHTTRDLETGICTSKLFYDKQDETELLIQLLSFGPVLEILGPPHFRELARERVMRQNELLKKTIDISEKR